MTSNQIVRVFVDGSTVPVNPGSGGWGAVLVAGDKIRGMYGHVKFATNNYMELFGVVCAVEAVRWPCRLEIISDSQYVVGGIRVIAAGSMYKTNVGLWRNLKGLLSQHSVKATHVYGHATTLYNELAHELSRLGSKQKLNGSFYVHELTETRSEAKLYEKVQKRVAGRQAREERRLARMA